MTSNRPTVLTLIFLAIESLCVPTYAGAQQTIVAASRSVDWSKAGTSTGTPYRTTTCSTLSPGVTAAQINQAIAGCPAGQVVMLNAGTYTLNAGLSFNNKSNVTLRGAGPDQTFLVFTGTGPCIGINADVCVRTGTNNNAANPDNTANWTAGFAKGTTQITLSNTSNIGVGTMLILDQLNDPDTDNGNLWVCETQNVCATEGPGGVSRTGRTQMQIVVVTAVSGNTVTFAPGLYLPNWRSSQSPGAWWPNSTVTGIGIEDLSLDHGASTNHVSGMFFSNARESWVRNVRSLNSNRNHVWLYQTAKVTILNSYFYGTQNGAQESYGVELGMSSDTLIQNNIFHHVAAPMMIGNATEGNVLAYNYAIDDYYPIAPNWQEGSSQHHDAGSALTLFEGNDGVGFIADAIHGTADFMTAFRNRWLGHEGTKLQQTDAALVYAFNRYFNFVGNVLGVPGFHTNYECFPVSALDPLCATGASLSIYMLGWSDNEARFASVNNDTLVRSTLMRWGNYDVVTGTRFLGTEVPSGLSQFANPVPSTQTLPASFYLSGKPGWWPASVPWPAVGPDVSPGEDTTGHAYRIPAHVCYDTTAQTGGILNFNGNRCYANPVGPPAPPSNLRIIK